MAEITIDVDLGSVRALPIPPTSADVTVITSDCRLVGWSLRDTSAPFPADNEGSVLSPAAFQAIVFIGSLPAGTYDVTWTVALQGAAAAADADNFQLVTGGTVLDQSINAGAAGSYPQLGVRFTASAGGNIFIRAFGAGTVGVTYLAQLSITPTPVAATVVEVQDTGNILGEISLAPGASGTNILSHEGIPCQGEIKLHVISGQVTGVVYARLSR